MLSIHPTSIGLLELALRRREVSGTFIRGSLRKMYSYLDPEDVGGKYERNIDREMDFQK